MRLLKPLMILSTAGILAACDEQSSGNGGFPPIGTGGGSSSNVQVTDSQLAGKIDSARSSDGALAYSYYVDTISDGSVLAGADRHCGGPGQAGISLTNGTKGGREYNTMVITCR